MNKLIEAAERHENEAKDALLRAQRELVEACVLEMLDTGNLGDFTIMPAFISKGEERTYSILVPKQELHPHLPKVEKSIQIFYKNKFVIDLREDGLHLNITPRVLKKYPLAYLAVKGLVMEKVKMIQVMTSDFQEE